MCDNVGMKKTLCFALLAAFVLTGCGKSKDNPTPPPSGEYGYNFYDGYYGELKWDNGEDLKSKLHNIISTGFTSLPYEGFWALNQKADLSMDDLQSVDVVYGDENELATATSYSGTGWQKEHAFAASLMTGYLTGDAVKCNTGRATDYHNLFASNNSGNGSRGNKNFGIANKSDPTYKNCTSYSYDSKNFEPTDNDKGRLARAVFYMGVMYNEQEQETINGQLVTYEPLRIVEEYVEYSAGNCQFAIGNLSTLLSWNSFAVDYVEMQHNITVYTGVFDGKTQGNRNPFVDYPGLVDYVYGSKKNEAGDLNFIKPSYLSLKMDKDELINYAVDAPKREYAVGETFDSSSYTFKEVRSNLTQKAASFTNTNQPYTFLESDIGKKNITLVTPINNIVVSIKVSSKSSSDFSYSFVIADSGVFTTKTANGATVALGDLNWTVSWTNTNAKPYQNNSKFGYAFGTGTNPCQTFVIKTASSLSNVNSAYFLGSCGSKKSMNYKISVVKADSSETIIKQGSYTRPQNTEEPELFGGDLATPVSGVVTITITNLDSSFYLHTIYLNQVS